MRFDLDPLTDKPRDDADSVSLPHQARRSLPIALLRAREAVMMKFRPMLARHDINEQQWRVIRMLAEFGEMDASELADKALILAPSLSRMIITLQKNKLITRRKDKQDGRRVLVALAPKGKDLIKEIAPESRSIYVEMESKFDPHKMDQLLDLLEEVIQKCGDVAPPSADDAA